MIIHLRPASPRAWSDLPES